MRAANVSFPHLISNTQESGWPIQELSKYLLKKKSIHHNLWNNIATQTAEVRLSYSAKGNTQNNRNTYIYIHTCRQTHTQGIHLLFTKSLNRHKLSHLFLYFNCVYLGWEKYLNMNISSLEGSIMEQNVLIDPKRKKKGKAYIWGQDNW